MTWIHEGSISTWFLGRLRSSSSPKELDSIQEKILSCELDQGPIADCLWTDRFTVCKYVFGGIAATRDWGHDRRRRQPLPHQGDAHMIAFSVGDRVIIRYGEHQGQKGRITGTQAAAVYEVAMAGGFVLFFCAGGLEKDESREGSPRGHSVHPSEPCISARKRGGRLSL